MHWPMVPLGKLAEIVGGSTPSRTVPEYWGGSIPWTTPTDLPMPGTEIAALRNTAESITKQGLASSAANLLPVGAVLFSSRATIGKLAIAEVPVATNQGFANFVCGPAVFNRYLAWALLHYTSNIERLAGSTTFKEVSKTSLKGFRIPLPPISEQRRIVELLDEAERLRKLRREGDIKAARILPALFLKMFGDPATNPKGWPTCPMSQVCEEIYRYPTYYSIEYAERGIPEVRGELLLPNGSIDDDSTKLRFISPDTAARFPRTSLLEGDLVMSVRGTIGKIGVVPKSLEGGNITANLLRISPKRSVVRPPFLFAFLSSAAGIGQVSSITTSTTISTFRSTDFQRILVPTPPISLQNEFADRTNVINAMLQCIEQSRAYLNRLWQVLVQQAFSAQLTVKWRDTHMKALIVEMNEQASLLQLPAPEAENLTAEA